MKTPLVIIDMQSGFLTSISQDDTLKLVKAIQKQIRLAKKRKAPVFVVELWAKLHGPTIETITQMLKNYERTHICEKQGSDGSLYILALSETLQINPSKFRVCGVFSTACVAATVDGLIGKGKRVEVDTDSTATTHPDSQAYQVKRWRKQNGVAILK